MQGPKRHEADLLVPSTDTHNHQNRPNIAVQRIARSPELSASLTHVMHKGTLTISVLGHVRVIHLSSTKQIRPIRSFARSGIVLENCYDLSVRCRWIISRPLDVFILLDPDGRRMFDGWKIYTTSTEGRNVKACDHYSIQLTLSDSVYILLLFQWVTLSCPKTYSASRTRKSKASSSIPECSRTTNSSLLVTHLLHLRDHTRWTGTPQIHSRKLCKKRRGDEDRNA